MSGPRGAVTDLQGPWEIAGCQVSIGFSPYPRLIARRDDRELPTLPVAVRRSPDFSWLHLTLAAAVQHARTIRLLLEESMINQAPIPGPELHWLWTDPAGSVMIENVVISSNRWSGLPIRGRGLMVTGQGEVVAMRSPVQVTHPLRLVEEGVLDAWLSILNRGTVRQPFQQIRRQVFTPGDAAGAAFSDRFLGEAVVWQQTRAILEGRRWQRVTARTAERRFSGWRTTAHLEMSRSRSLPDGWCKLGRLFFLPTGDPPVSKERPGLELREVPPIVFSEAMRDVALAAAVGGRLQERLEEE